MFRRKPKPELPDWIRVYRRPSEYIGGKVRYSYKILIEESRAKALKALNPNIRVNLNEQPGETYAWNYKDVSFLSAPGLPIGWQQVAVGDHKLKEYNLELEYGESIAWGLVKAYNGIKNIQLGWEQI